MKHPSDLSPRWGVWFVDWLNCDLRGDGWEVWHKEMLIDHKWYLDFWEAEQDWYRSLSYYADWQEADKLVQAILAVYYAWGFSVWQIRLALFKLETRLLLFHRFLRKQLQRRLNGSKT